MAQQIRQEELITEKIYKVVQNTRRRYLLYYLGQNGGTASVEELVDRIATWEEGGQSDGVASKKRESVYSSLYQTHLPKLEKMGLITHDTINRTVSITERGDRISIYCAANALPEIRFSKLTLGLNCLILSNVVLAQLEGVPSKLVLKLCLVWVIGLLLVILWQIYTVRQWKRRYWQRGPDYIIELDDN